MNAMTNTETQTLTTYDALGGDVKVRELVDRFYNLMELDTEFAGIRVMHPTPMDGSQDKLYWFLSGWLGGPQMFVERFGHPRLRARHLPFSIGISERDQWLRCMDMAMRDVGVEARLHAALMESFAQTADWMRNKQT